MSLLWLLVIYTSEAWLSDGYRGYQLPIWDNQGFRACSPLDLGQVEFSSFLGRLNTKLEASYNLLDFQKDICYYFDVRV